MKDKDFGHPMKYIDFGHPMIPLLRTGNKVFAMVRARTQQIDNISKI